MVLASNNPGKISEIRELIGSSSIDIIPQSELDIEAAAETGLSFVENAIIKARHAARHSGFPAFADDSGLEVPALMGKPGIYSARYAGVGASDEENLNKLIRDTGTLGEKDRKARFVCLMVFIRFADDPVPVITQGIWDGRVISEPRGENGFGYDPVFYVPTHRCTSAELAPEIKNQISHRGQALRKMIEKLTRYAERC